MSGPHPFPHADAALREGGKLLGVVNESLSLGSDIPGVDVLALPVTGCVVSASLCLRFFICKVGQNHVSEIMNVKCLSQSCFTVKCVHLRVG